MPSKVIFDSPALLDESLVSVADACELFPVPCSRQVLERYIRQGSRGVVLESILLCGRRWTSREAIDRFVRNQLHVVPDRPEPRKGHKSKREIADACRKFGLPKPLDAN